MAQAKKDAPTKDEQPQQGDNVDTIKQLKGKVCKSLMAKFQSADMRDRLIHLAGGDESLVIANLNSFLTVITNDEGHGSWKDKKYICMATVSSLALCFMESMQLGLPIDRRKLVHVVVYGNQAELEIDYKGFIHYLSKHYVEPDFDIKLVFEGDKFHHWSNSGDDHYEYEKAKDRTENNYNKVVWAFMHMTYLKNGRERSKLEVMDKRELDLVKSKAKTQKVWDEWLGEMYKKAVCRRACKLPLAAVDETGIESVDNKNFQLEHEESTDKLQKLIERQRQMTTDEVEPQPAPEPTPEPSPSPEAPNGQDGHIREATKMVEPEPIPDDGVGEGWGDGDGPLITDAEYLKQEKP